jgi:hypothetical protein
MTKLKLILLVVFDENKAQKKKKEENKQQKRNDNSLEFNHEMNSVDFRAKSGQTR